MSDDSGSRQGRPPAEGVRIIRAEEAQAAIEAGEAAGRRPDDQPRFGDVPPAPSGPRPAHRFPLPDTVDPAQAVALPPLAPVPGTAHDRPGAGTDRPAPRYQPPSERPAPVEHAAPVERASDRPVDRAAPAERAADRPAAPPPAAAWFATPTDRTTELAPSVAEIPEEGITVSGSAPEMPHWSDPPTGEVPRLRLEDDEPPGEEEDLRAWQALGARAVRWRDDDGWDEEDELSDLIVPDEERSGALDTSRAEHSDLYSFDEDFERVAASRSGQHPVVDLTAVDDPEAQASDADWAEAPPPERRARRGRRPEPAEPAGGFGGEGTTAEPRVATVSSRWRPEGETRAGAHRTGGGSGGGAGARGRRPAGRPSRPTNQSGGGDFSSRVVVGGVLAALLVVASVIGPKALVVLAAVVVSASAAEAYNMTRGPGFRPATLLGLVATVGCIFGAYNKGIGAIPVVTVLLFVGSMLWYILGVVEARPLANVAVTVMVFVWVSVLGSFSAVLLQARHGEGLFLGAVLVAITADISAYVVGRWIGSRPLAAAISPGKTWEGFVGGVIASVIVGLIIGKYLTPWGGMKHGFVLGLVIGLIAPVGDLFESMLKRDLGLKDSGSVLGGHGGLLDRFDGLLIALPAAYFVATVFKL